jgi:hypothetical protein
VTSHVNFYEVMSGNFHMFFTVGVTGSIDLYACFKQFKGELACILYILITNDDYFGLWSVTTADSQRIRKDQNDLSNPGAQQRVESISAQQKDYFVMEKRKLSKITCLKHIGVGVKLKEKRAEEKCGRRVLMMFWYGRRE